MNRINLNLITLFTPTPENVKGPSALIYYLIKYRPCHININIYTYNWNDIPKTQLHQISKNLQCNITQIPPSLFLRLIYKLKLTKIRLFLKYPLLSYVCLSNNIKKILDTEPSDLIWIYPDSLFRIIKKNPSYKYIITGPDCSSLPYFRMLDDPYIYQKPLLTLGYAKLLVNNIRLDKENCNKNCLYHVVGMEDWKRIRQISPTKNAFFLLHPHYELIQDPIINFQKEKLKLLIAGNNDFYMSTGINELIPVLCSMNDLLKEIYEITFLGKGWESICEKLSENKIQCNIKKWVKNYIEEISQYDIQLTPITIGAGTKGKVLDAIGNGVLTIGTRIALENIAVRHMESCIMYNNAEEIPIILTAIQNNKQKYQSIAKKGMQQVRQYHSPKRLSKRFFEITNKFFNIW